jgi:hypothetical protein
MGDAIKTIGGFFGKAAPAIAGGSAAAGLFGNIMNMIQRGNETSKLQAAEKKFANLTPEQLSGLVTRAEQPIGQDLLQNVGNLVQADLGTRGLSESPGVFAAEETQTLAPYKIQQQQIALQLVMKQLGLPIEYADAILKNMGGNVDVSPLLKLLMQKGGSTTASTDTSGLSFDPAVIQDFLNNAPGAVSA